MRTAVKHIAAAAAFLFVSAAAQVPEPKKCATFDRYKTPAPPGVSLKAAIARPDLQASILSPSGHFRIHFDTTGANVPAMVTPQGFRIEGTAAQFVDTAAAIFDSVWRAEVTTFGYAAPPPDNGEGGGDEYDIYIAARSSNDFGETVWDDADPLTGTTAAPRYRSYISIDNDYNMQFRTIGIAALMSTAAHEFHHAIQVGGYGLWSDDLYFYELSAEAMEPVVFPYSKDYVNDIPAYFDNISNISLYTPFGVYPGYERAIWSVFLTKRYGTSVMREVWEGMKAAEPVPAMKAALERRGTSLPREFSEFCFWNYFTGSRADSVQYYTDAKLFPQVALRDRQRVGAAAVVFQYVCKGFGVNYLEAVHGEDTASFIVANTNMNDALGQQSNSYGYQLRLSAAGGGTELVNGMFADFTVMDPGNWKYLSLVASVPTVQDVAACFPNPFKPSISPLFIRLNDAQAAHGAPTLSVFSSSFDRVFTGSVPTQMFNGIPYAEWDGITTTGGSAATGIYIYVLESGGSSTKGKFAVIR